MTFDGWKKLYILAGKTFSYQDWRRIKFSLTDAPYDWLDDNKFVKSRYIDDWRYEYIFTDKFVEEIMNGSE